ncbi:unnamed protein product [Didymodactylos carnosus]|uniref:HAT C-terminal dimerisation domain-containing protein n=1 Tax=Didymodactylos carnosus TaxID=1234261 RepID=A0A814ZMT1_9BILA|nr:unnamed protein product [Didymodactylos carnosus]CAF4011892.1 unnamed protein product [Didymodactylos carnosus]
MVNDMSFETTSPQSSASTTKPVSSLQGQQQQTQKTKPPTAFKKFWLSVQRQNTTKSSKSTSSSTSIDDELMKYRTIATLESTDIIENDKPPNALQFWASNSYQLPIFSSLVQRFLSTPATSVASESCFSIASYLHRKQRNRLSPSNLAHIVFLKDKFDCQE